MKETSCAYYTEFKIVLILKRKKPTYRTTQCVVRYVGLLISGLLRFGLRMTLQATLYFVFR